MTIHMMTNDIASYSMEVDITIEGGTDEEPALMISIKPEDVGDVSEFYTAVPEDIEAFFYSIDSLKKEWETRREL